MTGKPIPLNRTGGNWEEFNLKLKAFVWLRSEPLVREMEWMEEPNAVDPDLDGVSVDIGTENRNLYYDLTMLTTGTSLKLVKGVAGKRAGGLQAAVGTLVREAATWRGCRRSCSGTAGTSATETLDSLAAWESEIEEREQLTRKRMADSIKLCVLDSEAPKELSTYLRLHTQAEETFATVKRKMKQSSGNFQGYCGNCGKWSHPQRECWRSRSTIWRTAPRRAATRGWTPTTAPVTPAQAPGKVASRAASGSMTRTRGGSSQLAVQDCLLDSKGVQVSGARSSSTAAARRPCAARSTSLTAR